MYLRNFDSYLIDLSIFDILIHFPHLRPKKFCLCNVSNLNQSLPPIQTKMILLFVQLVQELLRTQLSFPSNAKNLFFC